MLYSEGQDGAARMMSIGLHCRLIDRPGKLAGLKRFVDNIGGYNDVWCPRRIDIAEHWQARHPPVRGPKVHTLSEKEFAGRFAEMFPGARWVAERAAKTEKGPAHDCLAGVRSLLCRTFRSATAAEQQAVGAEFEALGFDVVLAGDRQATRRNIEIAARQRLAAILNEKM